MLTGTQKQEFTDNGFIVLPDFKSARQVSALKTRAVQIAKKHDLAAHKEIFSTDRQKGAQADKVQDYVLSSANEIRCFFEEKAFDENGQLNDAKTVGFLTKQMDALKAEIALLKT